MKHSMRKLQMALALSAAMILLVTNLVLAAALRYQDAFAEGPASGTLKIIGADTLKKKITSTTTAGVLGGERDIVLTLNQWDAEDLSKGASLYVNNGILFINSDDAVKFTAELQWDGSGDPAEDGKETLAMGLTGTDRDLTWNGTESGKNDRFIFGMPASDISGYITVIVYEDATHCRVRTFTVSGEVSAINQRVYEATFNTFASGVPGGYCTDDITPSARNFKDVGAVAMKIVSNSPAWDLGLEFLAIGKDYKDFGDLPDNPSDNSRRYDRYQDDLDSPVQHAQHVDTGLALGVDKTVETATKRNNPKKATGDEDNGVTIAGNWVANTHNGGKVSVKVSGCPGTCYLSAFIDWDNSGSFWTIGTPGHFDPNERVLTNYPVTNSTDGQEVSFDIPAIDGGLGGKTFFARFRLTETEVPLVDGAASPWGTYYSGEVEDYDFTYGPNAIILEKFEATSSNAAPIWPFALLLIPAAGLVWISVYRRK